MATQNLGQIIYNHKGDYSPSTTYQRLDTVRGSALGKKGLWASKKNNNTSALSVTESWDFIISDGEIGLTGVGIDNIVKTSTADLQDTYTITYTDDTTSTFVVTNGSNAVAFMLQSDDIPTYDNLPTNLNDTTDLGKAYLNQEDGLVYVWDGNSFAPEGSGLKLETMEIFEPITPVKNHDELTWINGRYLDQNGNWISYAGFSYTEDYIKVGNSKIWRFNSTGYAVVWYDGSYNVIGYGGDPADDPAIRTFTIPSGAVYGRINQLTANIDYFVLYDTAVNIRIKREYLSAIPELTKFVEPIILESDLTWTNGKYLDENGIENVFAPFSFSNEYIPTDGAIVWRFVSSGIAVIWYDSNLNVIGYGGNPAHDVNMRAFEIPVNASFGRINQAIAGRDEFALYTSFKEISIDNEYLSFKENEIPNNAIVGARQERKLSLDLSEYAAQSVIFFPFSEHPISGNVTVLGDSTIASYMGGVAVSSFLSITGTLIDIAVPGDTIADQLADWNALSSTQKMNTNIVFCQIGLNNLNTTNPASDIISEIQDLVDVIKADAPGAIVFLGEMIPCRARFLDTMGASDADIIMKQWTEVNSMLGTINGVTNVARFHASILGDLSNNLLPKYDLGDGIHENNNARRIIAYSWLSTYHNS